MSEKSLSTLVLSYKKVLASGDVQTVYQSLVGIVQHLRTGFAKKYNGEFTAGNVMHGYIDFTYFYLQNAYLKKHKLKFAIVLNHSDASFELWLLGQTKEVQKRYWSKLQGVKWIDEQSMPEYSIFEVALLSKPDFDNTDKISTAIYGEFEKLSKQIIETLEAYE